MATDPQPSFTDAQMQTLFTGVMDLMVQARWLRSYTLTKGKGYHLTWTEVGTERACVLKKISDTFQLESVDQAPLVFDAYAHGSPLPAGAALKGDLGPEIPAYWRESVAQLSLPRDEDHLLALVHIVTGWAPDTNTPIQFGS